MAQQVNPTERTTASGSTTNSNSPGQGAGGQVQQGPDDSQIPATGSRRPVASIASSSKADQPITQSTTDAGEMTSSQRRGQGDEDNFQGQEEMGIYMALPSTETPGKYVEFDNLGADAAHELTGMYKRAKMSSSDNTEIHSGQYVDKNPTDKMPSNFNGETDMTAKYGHSGTPGKSLAPDSEDGRKTSPIRGGKGEGVNQQARNQNDKGDSNS